MNGLSLMTASLALFAGLLWGAADFCCGTLSRRLPILTLTVLINFAGLVGLVFVLVAIGGWRPLGAYLLWGAVAGLVMPVTLLAFFRALAEGCMCVVAPITATGVAIPVLVGMVAGERPSPAQVGGIVAAIGGVIMVTAAELCTHKACQGRSVVLAVVAAIGAGSSLALIAQGSATSVQMTMLAQRVVAAVFLGALLLAARMPARTLPHELPLIGFVGLIDLAAIAAYATAARSGPIVMAAVLASLYPVVTSLLAWRLLAERPGRVQSAGATSTFFGVVLIASG